MPSQHKSVSQEVKAAADRSLDKDWVRSNDGQNALNAAREEALRAIRKLESPNTALVDLIKKKFA